MLLKSFIEGSTQCNCEIGLFPQGVADTPHAKTDGFLFRRTYALRLERVNVLVSQSPTYSFSSKLQQQRITWLHSKKKKKLGDHTIILVNLNRNCYVKCTNNSNWIQYQVYFLSTIPQNVNSNSYTRVHLVKSVRNCNLFMRMEETIACNCA